MALPEPKKNKFEYGAFNFNDDQMFYAKER